MSESFKMKLIDDSIFDLTLEKVRFDKLEISKGLAEDAIVRLRTKDSHRIKKITDNRLELEFKREKFFEPAGFFTIEVVLTIGYNLRPSKDKDKKKIIEQEIKDESFRLLIPAATRASIIVSSLTDVDWRSPVVDPPYPINEGED